VVDQRSIVNGPKLLAVNRLTPDDGVIYRYW